MEKNKQYVGSIDRLSVADARDQLGLLHRNGVIYFWLHVFAATLLCMFLWFKVDIPPLLTTVWYVAIVLLATGYWVLLSRFAASQRMTQAQLNSAVQYYRLVSILLCALWGLSGIILFCDVPIGQAIHVCLLMVITFSVWPVLLLSKAAFYLQLALLLSPITFMLAMQNDPKTTLLCIVILAFVGMIYLTTQLFSQVMNHLFDKQQALVEQVHTDPVTQLINRSYFDKVFKNEWRRSAREGNSLSLLLIEIDNFQQLEIKKGTHVSEQYLQVTTHCLKSIARRGSDTLARYGRSEFIALLPGTSLDAATAMAEQLRQAVERTQMVGDGCSINVTIGVSSCVPTVNPVYNHNADAILYPAALLSMAYQALQRAKTKGHNQVEAQRIDKAAPALTPVYSGEAYSV